MSLNFKVSHPSINHHVHILENINGPDQNPRSLIIRVPQRRIGACTQPRCENRRKTCTKDEGIRRVTKMALRQTLQGSSLKTLFTTPKKTYENVFFTFKSA